MTAAAVSTVAPASSRICSGSSEDGAENEARLYGKSAQANPDSDGTEEGGLHDGPEGCDQHHTKKQGLLHCMMLEA